MASITALQAVIFIRNSRVVVVSCQLLLQGLQLRHGVKRRLERKAHGFVNVFLRVKMTRLFQVAAGCPRRKGSVTRVRADFRRTAHAGAWFCRCRLHQ